MNLFPNFLPFEHHECAEPSIFAHVFEERVEGLFDFGGVSGNDLAQRRAAIQRETAGTAQHRAQNLLGALQQPKLCGISEKEGLEN